MCTASLQMLADSLRIWYTAKRDTLLVRNKILGTYMLQLLQEIVHDSLPCVARWGARHSIIYSNLFGSPLGACALPLTSYK